MTTITTTRDMSDTNGARTAQRRERLTDAAFIHGRGRSLPCQTQLHRDCRNQLWVTDPAYVPTCVAMAYVCFIVDAFSRMIVG